MEGYLTFQWRGLFFRWRGGTLFLSGEDAPWGGLGFDGGVFEIKSVDGGGAPHALPPLW